jgi:hypothetical protein
VEGPCVKASSFIIPAQATAKAVKEGVTRGSFSNARGLRRSWSMETSLLDLNLTDVVSGGNRCPVHRNRPGARLPPRRNAFR